MMRSSLLFGSPPFLLLSLALTGCGGNVIAQTTGDPGAGGSGGQGGETSAGGAAEGGASTTSSSSGAGGAGGTACDGLGEIACLKAYPDCVPVYDDMCCPMCDPMAGCADCVNWAFHHCAPHADGCLPEQPAVCGTVPGWACAGGAASCEPPSPATKIPCATIPGCVVSYCPTDVDCETDPVCVPVDGDMCDIALCNAIPPACPDGTFPAVEGGCYSGACIPQAFCAQ